MATISYVSLVCEETGFFLGKCHIPVKHPKLLPQLQSPLSALMPCGQGPGDCTQVVTRYYSMENIQTIAVVQMSNFSKQAELGEKGLYAQNNS